jgi:hypothetical protein
VHAFQATVGEAVLELTTRDGREDPLPRHETMLLARDRCDRGVGVGHRPLRRAGTAPVTRPRHDGM